MQAWFDEYGVSHKNPTNKLIHWICVPSIFFSVVGLFASIPSQFISELFPVAIAPFVHFGSIFVLIGILFYVRISLPIAIGMLAVAFIVIYGNTWLKYNIETPLWLVSTIIFVVAWIGQFIGHNIEGAKPSFFKDLQFLMIGPAWLLGFIYRKIGIKY